MTSARSWTQPGRELSLRETGQDSGESQDWQGGRTVTEVVTQTTAVTWGKEERPSLGLEAPNSSSGEITCPVGGSTLGVVCSGASRLRAEASNRLGWSVKLPEEKSREHRKRHHNSEERRMSLWYHFS